MRTSSAYLAAYRSGIAHSDCVTIVREALREPGLCPRLLDMPISWIPGWVPTDLFRASDLARR